MILKYILSSYFFFPKLVLIIILCLITRLLFFIDCLYWLFSIIYSIIFLFMIDWYHQEQVLPHSFSLQSWRKMIFYPFTTLLLCDIIFCIFILNYFFSCHAEYIHVAHKVLETKIIKRKRRSQKSSTLGPTTSHHLCIVY